MFLFKAVSYICLYLGLNQVRALSNDVSLIKRDVFTGDLTYYEPFGGYGSCGTVLQNNDMICALAFATTDAIGCNKCVSVTGPKGTVTVRVMDKCAGCKPHDIDLSRGAFEQIADIAVGRLKVSWTPVDCSSGVATGQSQDGTMNAKSFNSNAPVAQPLAQAQDMQAAVQSQCGEKANGAKCQEGYCCSLYGFCGQGENYCKAGCQSGPCFAKPAIPAASDSAKPAVNAQSAVEEALSKVDAGTAKALTDKVKNGGMQDVQNLVAKYGDKVQNAVSQGLSNNAVNQTLQSSPAQGNPITAANQNTSNYDQSNSYGSQVLGDTEEPCEEDQSSPVPSPQVQSAETAEELPYCDEILPTPSGTVQPSVSITLSQSPSSTSTSAPSPTPSNETSPDLIPIGDYAESSEKSAAFVTSANIVCTLIIAAIGNIVLENVLQ